MTGNDACGMQVHVSQGEGKWELKDLQAMSHNIIYFECAIDALPPMARRDTPAAPRNSWSVGIASVDVKPLIISFRS
ncbi:uncharacterized protein N7446_012857 [Penicillium canescens]|uniref:Uncharacterized protein n=1 Tax=Penicillium canescens TaxID=5083 RepID=A0AAD6HY73_PENCN|nr:uncharacterized protein N7446_012857 [Penicillium canescens]KAJ6022506.1 hypothetical protein N7460_012901 [Penicillium canescens]KAJ6041791.1 hypothetical protein N7446_012857 [Penicillium canescens]